MSETDVPDHTETPDPQRVLTAREVDGEDLADWRFMLGRLHGRFHTGDFVSGLGFAQRIADAAEEADHHPDLDLRYSYVDVRLTSHDAGGVTSRDLALARRVSEIAAGLGADPDPDHLQTLEIALDTSDVEAVKPFWRALLGYRDSDHAEEVVDPSGELPTLWFQRAEPAAPGVGTPAQRFHLDVWVAPGQAEARVRAVLDAGGTLESDDAAPSFWVLADSQGNRACVCTSEGRG